MSALLLSGLCAEELDSLAAPAAEEHDEGAWVAPLEPLIVRRAVVRVGSPVLKAAAPFEAAISIHFEHVQAGAHLSDRYGRFGGIRFQIDPLKPRNGIQHHCSCSVSAACRPSGRRQFIEDLTLVSPINSRWRQSEKAKQMDENLPLEKIAQPDSSPLSLLMTVEEVAELLQCHPASVNIACSKGRLPGVKFGRGWVIPRAALAVRLTEIALEESEARRNYMPKILATIVDPAKPRSRRRPLASLGPPYIVYGEFKRPP